jgi:hypothetical protein
MLSQRGDGVFPPIFNFGVGPNDATQWILNVHPVIPITLNKDWNLITRTPWRSLNFLVVASRRRCWR